MDRPLPQGYVDRDRGRWRVIAPRLELPEMEALLDAARRGQEGGEPVSSGRGGTRRVALAGGAVLFLRHYLRGGWMRLLSRDLYLLRPPRPLRELVATEVARSAGCHVPRVHAVAVEEAGPFYRGWIATSAIDGAVSLIDALAGADPAGREQLLDAVGGAVRTLHRAGVYHRDLTGHNVLVDARGEVGVIDFDRAVLDEPDVAERSTRGLERLWRSLRKLGAQRAVPMDEEARRWLERGHAG